MRHFTQKLRRKVTELVRATLNYLEKNQTLIENIPQLKDPNPTKTDLLSKSDEWIPKDNQDAEARYKEYKSKDPFPHIKPALLNSADLSDYVAATGMIFPFYPNDENLKPASYSVSLLGVCIYWDKGGKKHKVDLKKGQRFALQPNSIAFVSLEPRFRIPDYIALRFNLQISHIHRGLLLGTGPLVDPGYDGNLLIPLHNLTNNDYVFKGGDPLIWIEFTKLSSHEKWSADSEIMPIQQGKFYPFSKDGNPKIDVEKFLSKVEPERSIRSSIPPAILSAERSAKWSSRYIQGLSAVGLLAIIIGLTSFLSGWFEIISFVNSAKTDEKRLKTLEEDIERLKSQVNSSNNNLSSNETVSEPSKVLKEPNNTNSNRRK